MSKVASRFKVGPKARFHNSRGGASLLVHLTADRGHPTHAVLQDVGVLHVHLQTGARGSRLEQILEDYLARHLRLSPGQVAVVAGEGRPRKIVAVYDISPRELERRMTSWLGNPAWS